MRRSVCTRWLVPSLLLLCSTPALAGPGGGGGNCVAKAQVSGGNSHTAAEGTLVDLNGQPSSPNGGNEPISYLWQQTAGTPVVLSSTTGVAPSFTAPQVGASGETLTFRLTVTGCSPSQTDSVLHNVSITDIGGVVNTAPDADATANPNPSNEGDVVTLSAAGSSDAEGDTLTYTWSQLSGTPVSLSDATAISPTFTAPNTAYPLGDTLEFQVVVSDGTLTGTATVLANIVWVDDPPVASLSCPETVNEGANIHFDGSGSTDSDDGIASYAWLQTVLPPDLGIGDETGSTVDVTAPVLSYQQDGFITVQLTVTDVAGQSAQDDCVVQILDITPPVISGADDQTVEATSPAGAIATFDVTASDNVDGAVPAVCVPASGSQFALGASQVDCAAEDSAGNEAIADFTITVVDTTAPVFGPLADVHADATSGAGAIVTYALPTATDIVDTDVEVVCTPGSGSQFALGATTVECIATDDYGNSSKATFLVFVTFDWTGFFRPIDNPPVINVVKAGQGIPVKFSLGGNMGLAIFAAGYPTSGSVACSSSLQDAVEETVTSGGSTLTYDAVAGQYVYVWKTEKSWAGSCRTLVVKLADGTVHTANFNFTR
jgi:hypothetical protein